MSFLRTRIKICGIKNPDDARVVSEFGADAIGLVFHPTSTRFIELAMAQSIRQRLPAFVTLTALFMNQSEAQVAEVVEKIRPDCLQFHGNETAEFCTQWNRPYIKAVAMGNTEDPLQVLSDHPLAQGFLLDSHGAGRQGGSGDTFDWKRVPPDFSRPLILAGGLNPNNVADAIRQVRPWAVDVSSGVESAKGIKDPTLIKKFCEEVKRVDCEK